MSSREVNADRKGPKDLIDLAQKAQAYKVYLGVSKSRDIHAQQAHDDRMATGDSNTMEIAKAVEAQNKVDDAFSAFAELHRHPETGEIDWDDVRATKSYLDAHLAKGKGL